MLGLGFGGFTADPRTKSEGEAAFWASWPYLLYILEVDGQVAVVAHPLRRRRDLVAEGP